MPTDGGGGGASVPLAGADPWHQFLSCQAWSILQHNQPVSASLPTPSPCACCILPSVGDPHQFPVSAAEPECIPDIYRELMKDLSQDAMSGWTGDPAAPSWCRDPRGILGYQANPDGRVQGLVIDLSAERSVLGRQSVGECEESVLGVAIKPRRSVLIFTCVSPFFIIRPSTLSTDPRNAGIIVCHGAGTKLRRPGKRADSVDSMFFSVGEPGDINALGFTVHHWSVPYQSLSNLEEGGRKSEDAPLTSL